MAILHGNWILKADSGYLFVWGETWRRSANAAPVGDVPTHPLAMTQVELVEWLRSQQSNEPRQGGNVSYAGISSKFLSQVIALPTYMPDEVSQTAPIYPVHSATISSEQSVYLQPWRVEGICLDALEAMKFLTSLPLGSAKERENAFLGGDLRFWSQIARWSLDLLSRCKFLPTLNNRADKGAIADWKLLNESAVDSSRLEKFAQLMPLACRTYQTTSTNPPHLSVELPLPARELLLGFLNSTINAQVRAVISTHPLPALQSSVQEWLQALERADNILKAAPGEVEQLEAALKAWTAPLQNQLALCEKLLRTCFNLTPPAPGDTEWTLAYLLQATDQPDFLVDAATLWNHPMERWVARGRTIEQPQETLLRGLGLASRLYAPIASSLEQPFPQFCRLTPLQAYEFLKSVAWRFEDSGLGVILPPSLVNHPYRLGLKISAQTPLKKQQGLGLQSLLNFKWELALGGQSISKTEFDRLVALNSPLVEINGEWVELRPQDIKTAQAFFAARKDQMSLSLEDALRLSTGDSQTIEKLPVVSFESSGTLQELISTLTNNQAIAPIPTPTSFHGQLRPYQARGASWLSFLERWSLGACLADDMGLGKTIEFIAFLLHLKEQEKLTQPTLLVCPTSVLGNWEREVKKFGPSLKVLLQHGDKRLKGKAFTNAVKDHDLVITSYALIQRDLKALQSVSWQGVVLDEAQNIKNPEAKQSQSVRQLQSSFRIALTGTPVENRLQELWSILDFLNPGYLGSRQFFQRRFAVPIERYGDGASLQTLRSLVQPFILRRLKTDREIIQDLPEKQEMTVFCGLSAEQATLYQQVVDQSLAEIESAQGVQRRGMILALLVKLKQICNHPAQYLKETTLGPQHHSGKLQRLQEMLEEALSEGDRALIFTQFAEWGKLLKPYLEQQLRREILFLYGSTTKKQREEMVDRFQHDPQGPPVMILSLKAGGVGLNLTRANHVFHFDRWWNPAVENQATDRVFRIGQTRNVQVHKFVCNGTLEEKIHEMIESKKALAQQVVSAGEQWLTELDTVRLRDLLILDRSAVIEEEDR